MRSDFSLNMSAKFSGEIISSRFQLTSTGGIATKPFVAESATLYVLITYEVNYKLALSYDHTLVHTEHTTRTLTFLDLPLGGGGGGIRPALERQGRDCAVLRKISWLKRQTFP